MEICAKFAAAATFPKVAMDFDCLERDDAGEVPPCLFEEEISDDVDDADDSMDVFSAFQSSALDNSLTNLQWLHSLQLTKERENAPPTPPSDASTVQVTTTTTTTTARQKRRKRPRPKPLVDPSELPENPTAEDYRTNKHLKPPHSYARLIYDAIKAENQPLITLSAIYNYIKSNFRYYCYADCSWQVWIRASARKLPCERKRREK